MKPTVHEINDMLNIVRDLIPFGIQKAVKFSDGYNYFCGNVKNHLEENHIVISCGATKFCLIPEESDWVIKLSFDMTDEFDPAEEEVDFCRREAYNYQRAVDQGLEKYFAATYKVGRVEDIDVYVQQKVATDSDKIEGMFSSYVENVYEDSLVDYTGDEYHWAVDDYVNDLENTERIEAVFGASDATCKLAIFIEKYEINDLHCANYGFVNGVPVIMDYSGYNIPSLKGEDDEED